MENAYGKKGKSDKLCLYDFSFTPTISMSSHIILIKAVFRVSGTSGLQKWSHYAFSWLKLGNVSFVQKRWFIY